MNETLTQNGVTYHKEGPTLYGDLLYDDISEAMAIRNPSVLEVDLETDRCDFSNPTFWWDAQTRLITVRDTSRGQVELVRVGPDSNPRKLRHLMRRASAVYFHHAMFDLTFLAKDFDIWVARPRCTKILAKVQKAMGDLKTESVSLKPLLSAYLDVEYPSNEAVSDWTAQELSSRQLEYAELDVHYLRDLYNALEYDLISLSLDPMELDLVRAHEAHLLWMIRSRMINHTGVFEH